MGAGGPGRAARVGGRARLDVADLRHDRTAFLLACGGQARWTRPTARSVIGLGSRLLRRWAAPALTVVHRGVFFCQVRNARRHDYRRVRLLGHATALSGSVGVGIFYCLGFASVAVTKGLGSQLWLQLLLVGGTVVSASVGAYLLERSQRDVFAQSRLVGALHDRVDMLLRTYLSPDVAATLDRTIPTAPRWAALRSS